MSADSRKTYISDQVKRRSYEYYDNNGPNALWIYNE